LQDNQQKRLVSKFDEYLNKELNKTIEKILNEINTQLKECENTIKQYFNSQIDDEIQNRIKINMKQTLFTNFTNFTKKFKLNQKIYAEKYKEFVGEDDPTFDISGRIGENPNEKKGDFLKTEESKNALQQRDNELSLLLNNVSELSNIFKDIQTLVMEQGSILDRIDYNIDIAGDNVVKSKNSITKANEYHKQSCFRNALLALIIIIFIEAFMLIFKFL
jgi:syntaxin 16